MSIRGADLGATVLSQDIYETSTTQKYRLGTRVLFGDRVYRYCKAGASITKTINGLANYNKPYEGDRPATAYVIGDDEITIPAASTGNAITYSTVDIYAGGYIWFQMDPQMTHRIRSNTATDGTNVVLKLDTPLKYALPAAADGSDTMWITAWPNIYSNVQHMAGGMVTAVCACEIAVASGSFFWGQTWGPKFFQSAGAAPGKTSGYRAVVFNNAGAVANASSVATGVQQHAGCILSQTTASDGDQFVMLQLTP